MWLYGHYRSFAPGIKARATLSIGLSVFFAQIVVEHFGMRVV